MGLLDFWHTPKAATPVEVKVQATAVDFLTVGMESKLQEENGVFKAYVPEFLYKPPYGWPRKDLNITLIDALVDNPYVFSILKTQADEVTNTPWKIVVKKKFNDKKEDYTKVVEDIEEFLKNPNGNDESFEHLLRTWVWGLGKYDAAVGVKVFNRKGEFKQLFSRCGALFLKNPDIYAYMGNRADFVMPLPQNFHVASITYEGGNLQQQELMNTYHQLYNTIDPVTGKGGAAFFQYGWTAGSMPVPFGKREVMYMMMNPQDNSIYGKSPLMVVTDILRILIYGSQAELEFYLNNNMLQGAFVLNDGDKEKLKVLKEGLRQRLQYEDNLGYTRRQFFNIPVLAGPVDYLKFQLTPEELGVIGQQEWFLKILFMAFGITSNELGFTESVNKASSETQVKVSERRSLRPYLTTFKYYIDTLLLPEFFASKKGVIPEFKEVPVEFVFEEENLDDQKKRLDLLEQQLRMGVKTRFMIAQEMGINVAELEESLLKEREYAPVSPLSMFNNDDSQVKEEAEDGEKEESVAVKSESVKDVKDSAKDFLEELESELDKTINSLLRP